MRIPCSSSDLGQPENPIHTSGLVTFFEQLRQRGFSEAEIYRMSRDNPARGFWASSEAQRAKGQISGINSTAVVATIRLSGMPALM